MNVDVKQTTLWLGPLLAIFSWSHGHMDWALNHLRRGYGGCVTVLCVVWWIFETIPIPATSLIPLALFPLLGILSAVEVSQAYGDKLVLLLLGGFILSQAMEKSGAHLRVALNMVRFVWKYQQP